MHQVFKTVHPFEPITSPLNINFLILFPICLGNMHNLPLGRIQDNSLSRKGREFLEFWSKDWLIEKIEKTEIILKWISSLLMNIRVAYIDFKNFSYVCFIQFNFLILFWGYLWHPENFEMIYLLNCYKLKIKLVISI